MKKEVIFVSKDKSAFDVLAEMGERTKNSWIFLHTNVINKLAETADYNYTWNKFEWKATKNYPATTLIIDSCEEEWKRVQQIIAEDIAFEKSCKDPEEIFFLKMEV